jgi:hypothetical protein
MDKRKKELKKLIEIYENQLHAEKDDFKKLTLSNQKLLMELLDDVYNQIILWAIANTGLKTQIELLRDILVQLPDVKVNWEIRKDIENAFKDYDKQAF